MKNTTPARTAHRDRKPYFDPGQNSLSYRQIAWLSLTALTVVGLVVVAFLPPFVSPETGKLIMSGFRKVCHQLPSRSFQIGETQVALCHRCVGIYAAIPLAILLFGVLRRWEGFIGRHPVWTIGASLMPMGIDWGADVVGIWSNTPTSRLVTGTVFGVVAGYFLARAVVNAAKPTTDAMGDVPAQPAMH
ncbi:MAG: DUF2085 domain-containing protein [Rhodothermia bacterium]|nr:DUF2085 domain-containing protein [Rhodothermia bacterium]